MNDYLNQANAMFDYTQNLRRDFHKHPELGFQEVRTSGIVARELTELGLEVSTGIAVTGVVGLLDTGRPGPTVLLRFDMDALPILEETGVEFASQNPGVMHACGHDGHTAAGLTVAHLLKDNIERLSGKIKFIFQPAEEGLGGAEKMLTEGVLQNPRPDSILTMHVWNEKPLGWLGITPGPVMAAAETFNVRIIGKGGHGAGPHLAVDPILTSAHVITALQSIVSRNVPPLETAVVSVTAVQGGEAFNVIPPEVELKGTIRTFDPEVRLKVIDRFQQVVNGVSEGMGCQAKIEINSITPAVINDPIITARVQNTAARLLPDCEIDTAATTMGSEDMAFLMRDVPGCYIFVGSSNSDKGLDAAHHNPAFNFDERALPMGAALIAAATTELLNY